MQHRNKQFSVEIPLDESQRHKVIWTDSEGNPTLSKETDLIIREVYSVSPECEIGCEIVNYSVGGLFLKFKALLDSMSVESMSVGELVEAFHGLLRDMMEQDVFEFDTHANIDLITFPISIYSKMARGDEEAKRKFREFGNVHAVLKELAVRIGDADRGLYNNWFSLIE